MNYCSCNDIVGYRFHPTDEELIDHYLWNKAHDRDSAVQAIGEVTGDLSDWEPGELPRFSVRRSNDRIWYLFSRRTHSKRVKRTTKLGYWKLTGKHRSIKAKVGTGTKKTLVFYEGRVPKGKLTPWVIHEYNLPDTLPNQKGYFLCKLKKKDDEKAGVSSGEGQPSNVAEDTPFDTLSVINVYELLAQLSDPVEVEHDGASVQKSQMYGEHVPVSSCDAACTGDDLDGVHNQSSTDEQNDEIYGVSSSLQSRMYEERVHSGDVFSFFCGSNGNFHELQHLSCTNEQDSEVQHQPDSEIQHQPSPVEQDDEIQHRLGIDKGVDKFFNSSLVDDDDEFFNSILVDDDERSDGFFVGMNGNGDIVGYRFHPTDKELVDHYLWNKILDRDSLVQAITQVDSLFNKDPWELPGCSKIKSADQVWYFFSRRGDSKRLKRTTDKGFWKVTGKARYVKGKNGCAEKRSLEGIFLCKLKKKEDENANTRPSENCRPSQNSTMFNPVEMLAALEEPDGRHDLHDSENLLSLSKQLLMHEHQLPCEEFTHLCDFTGSYDELPHPSNPEEQSDESWIRYLTDDAELYPDERSSEQVLVNGGCNLPSVDACMTFPGESSRKRSRAEDCVPCRAIVNEECQPMVVSDSMMLDEHAGSKKLRALAMVDELNATLTAVKHNPHGREMMTRQPHYEKERCQKLIEQKDNPLKFCWKDSLQDKAIDVKQPATAVNLPPKLNPIMESKGKWKTLR
ncbi:hypothetical protein V6N11_012290 [Hibiscus sabdariffa]|uniref:NAC domain-containing protein n=1 Tax=Hibiscus sabdariffa TaxID=183260 RepID=A0ABR2QAN9_9ROSI